MDTRRTALIVSAIILPGVVLACRVGTPTPTESIPLATPTRFATHTPLPTITPLPSPTRPPGNAYILQKAKVTGVNFYEGGPESPPYGERDYAVKFARSSSRYIYGEINFEYPAPGESIDFVVDTRWYGPDGEVVAEQPMETYVESDWTSSAHISGRGWDQPGKWAVGNCKVEFYVSGQMVATGSFEITGALPK